MKKNSPLILVIFTINFLFSEYIDVQFASFSYTIGGSYGSCVKFKKAEYAFSQFNECSCAWAANDSSYPNCYDLFYDPQTKIIKYNLSEGGEYIYQNFSNDYTCHIYEEETEPPECTEMDESECASNHSCDWIENTETGSCSSLSLSVCDLPEYGSCYSDCTNWGNYYNGMFCYGTMYCAGGSYQSDNSYCEESEYQLGDLNQDSIINVQDIILTVNLVLNNEYNILSDLNSDEIVNVLDIVQLVNIILN